MLHRTFIVANTREEAIKQSWRDRPMREEPKQHMYVDSQYERLQQQEFYWREQPTSHYCSMAVSLLSMWSIPVSNKCPVVPDQLIWCSEFAFAAGLTIITGIL